MALVVALIAVPATLSITVFVMDKPVNVGERSPRTIVAPDLIRVPDPEASARARREAAEEVEPVLVDDQEAKAAIVQNVRDAFAAVSDARSADQRGRTAKPREQIAAMRQRLPMLGTEALELLVRLDDDELTEATAEALSVAQLFARQRITAANVDTVVEEQLPTELIVREFPPGVANAVVDPIIRDSLRPTVRDDVVATQERREAAAADVSEVIRSYPVLSVVVAAGEVVDPVQMAALKQRGLEGAEPWRPIVKALLIALILTLAVSAYLRAYRRALWRSSRRMLLLAVLFFGFALTLEVIALIEPQAASGWRYVAPVGALVMLATILFDPPIGVLSALPAAVLVG